MVSSDTFGVTDQCGTAWVTQALWATKKEVKVTGHPEIEVQLQCNHSQMLKPSSRHD